MITIYYDPITNPVPDGSIKDWVHKEILPLLEKGGNHEITVSTFDCLHALQREVAYDRISSEKVIVIKDDVTYIFTKYGVLIDKELENQLSPYFSEAKCSEDILMKAVEKYRRKEKM